ncbi:hypothetical protein KFL_006950010 [Klebsormidium nitens]|uniref:Uncharacterized protein n=1 Tax=Klebsormidium nitens TaxID=105231 RepID=A0A1Y1IQ30_KLENI|nr:hypothetical protein KFL_006950010 [Klebsormidium nitens]|eukprot:GAQ90866.1 hypothetical protein KFL_006950010 [Klebsormidium nitens]
MTTSFKSRMERLRKGAHSKVMERDHIVVAGTAPPKEPDGYYWSTSLPGRTRWSSRMRLIAHSWTPCHEAAALSNSSLLWTRSSGRGVRGHPPADLQRVDWVWPRRHHPPDCSPVFFGKLPSLESLLSLDLHLPLATASFEGDVSAIMSTLCERPVLDEVEDSKIIVKIVRAHPSVFTSARVSELMGLFTSHVRSHVTRAVVADVNTDRTSAPSNLFMEATSRQT